MNLTIKNLPPGVHRALKHRAARNHRSLNGEVLCILEAESQRPTLRQIVAELEQINRRQKGAAVRHSEVRAGIEEGRE